ncbi:hypothetical protein ABZT04_40600 [Streptomyces sp. NPDC005492]|uniref:hypothetical protein n=1 Tax=Streptomyces sp. NPDC005492 TaxID=3156883 RepID=UPI0033A1C4CD
MPRTPNTRLQVLFEAAGSGPTQLAAALRGVAAENGPRLTIHHTTVRRWLAGTRLRPPAPALLLDCLSRRLDRPITAHEAGLTQAPAVVVDPAWQADPMPKLTHLTRTALDPPHRTLLGDGLFPLTAMAAVPDQGERPAPAARPKPHRGPNTAPNHATWKALVANTAVMVRSCDRQGGHHVRAALAAYLAHEVIPLLHRPARADVSRGLRSATSLLALLLGSMCADSNHHAAAQHSHQIAARLAADIGDRGTLVIALRTMATHAHDPGHHTPRSPQPRRTG